MINNNSFKKLYSLKIFTNTFGVSKKKVKTIGAQVGLNPYNNDLKLKKKNNNFILKNFKVEEYDKNLKLQIRKNIKFLIQARAYRGIRHNLKLPSRGQRTKTNARTKKGFKF